MNRGNFPSKKSLFNIIRTSKIRDISQLHSKLIISNVPQVSPDFSKLVTLISKLRCAVIQSGNNIDSIISNLESDLANGSNDTTVLTSFYTSKVFLDVIDAYNISLPEYHYKLLSLLEKSSQDKSISTYLSKNKMLFPSVLKFISKKNLYESSIKIAESLLMNVQSLYSVRDMEQILNELYQEMEKKGKLNAFCRILAVLIFDYKKTESKDIFKGKEILRIKPLTKTTTENQSICFHFPYFFQNLMKSLKLKFDKTKKLLSDSPSSRTLIEFLLHHPSFLDSDEDISFSFDVREKECIKANIHSILTYHLPHSKIKLENKELYSLVQLNCFESFLPDFSKLNPNQDNIYNTYIQLTKLLSKLENKTKSSRNGIYVTMFKFTTCQIEMLFVLATLLGGKRKIELQDTLGELNFIDILESYFEFIEWGNIFGDSNRPFFNDQRALGQDDMVYHGEGCCCEFDSVLKIQYLRSVYTFCCRDDNNIMNKLRMFSPNDIESFLDDGFIQIIIKNIKQKYNYYKNSPFVTFNKDFEILKTKLFPKETKTKNEDVNESIEQILLKYASSHRIKELILKYNNNAKSLGFLQKLIFKYMQECYYSSAKFWLSSCIEVMVRGDNTFFQTYIATSGILPCLLYDILYSKQEQNQILQLSFDILGELVKFNRGNFYLLNYYFVDSKEYSEFCKKIITKCNLVDSNVFLRALLLSNDFFDKTDFVNGVAPENYFTKKCKLCSFIREHTMFIFISLITIVEPIGVNQTNISCINTSIIILILSYLQGNLVLFLRTLRQKYAENVQKDLEHFKKLLLFWKNFYSFRPKDSVSLQYTTKISFNIWQEVTSLLLSEDTTNEMSLNYKEKIDL